MKTILVSDGTPQQFYIGKTDLLDQVIDLEVRQGGFITLHECRVLRIVMMPTPKGFSLSTSVNSVAHVRGPITLHVRPVSYFWAGDNVSDEQNLNKMIEACEQNETAHRMADAGLVSASGMPATAADGFRMAGKKPKLVS